MFGKKNNNFSTLYTIVRVFLPLYIQVLQFYRVHRFYRVYRLSDKYPEMPRSTLFHIMQHCYIVCSR